MVENAGRLGDGTMLVLSIRACDLIRQFIRLIVLKLAKARVSGADLVAAHPSRKSWLSTLSQVFSNHSVALSSRGAAFSARMVVTSTEKLADHIDQTRHKLAQRLQRKRLGMLRRGVIPPPNNGLQK